MTWELFELTGRVEDYLLYKGAAKLTVQEEVFQKAGTEAEGETVHGTDDDGDRHGTGRISVW